MSLTDIIIVTYKNC